MKDSLKLRVLRHRAMQDQHQIAQKLNVTVNNYSRIESGLDQLEGQLAEDVLRIYGVTATEFDSFEPQLSI